MFPPPLHTHTHINHPLLRFHYYYTTTILLHYSRLKEYPLLPHPLYVFITQLFTHRNTSASRRCCFLTRSQPTTLHLSHLIIATTAITATTTTTAATTAYPGYTRLDQVLCTLPANPWNTPRSRRARTTYHTPPLLSLLTTLTLLLPSTSHVDSPSPSWLTQLCRLPPRLQRFCRMAVAQRRFPVNI